MLSMIDFFSLFITHSLLHSQVDPSSLENVIVHLLDLAEARATAARKKANQVSFAAAAKVSDLDQEDTPESIMLSTMTVEGVKDRTDREVVVPWLKFLWEAYRAVLELLHKNAKLEKVYHKTCEKAFAFCLDYQRTLEFRRLCDMLRLQLSNIQRLAAQPARINRAGWEWTPESIEIHLQIRFNQLEVATTLEQWNEGFRTVEDIHQIMQLSKKAPKPKLMAAYYEKLTRVFWVSENLLFHAYAWLKFYTLSCEFRKDMKPEERAMLASNTVLAALCTPDDKAQTAGDAVHASHRSPLGLFDDEAILNEKNQQMAVLLDFRANPSRSALLADLVAKGVVNDVIPELKNVFSNLETKFHPLTLVKEVLPVVTFIKTQPQLSKYAKTLQKVSALHTVVQLSKVYSSIRISSVQKLFSALDFSYVEIEDVLCDAINKRQLSMQIDHSSGSYRFGSCVNVAPMVQSQLVEVGRAFQKVAGLISTPAQDDATERRQAFLQRVSHASKNQAAELLERKMVIERRKEGLERLVRERERDEIARKLADKEARRRDEQGRLEREEEQRRDEKVKEQKDQMHVVKIKMEMETLGKEMSESELKQMTEEERNDELSKAKKEVRKAREDDVKRLADQAKNLDYKTRALRIEAGKNVEAAYRKQEAIDKMLYDTKVKETLALQKKIHAEKLAAKERLGKLIVARGPFEATIIAKQKAAWDERYAAAMKEEWDAHRARKISKARFALSEEEERLLEEAERQREIEEEEEYDRLQAKQHEELQLEREREMEEANRRREKEAEEERRVAEEAAAREVVVPVSDYPEERSGEGSSKPWGSSRDRERGDNRGGRDFGFSNDRGGDRDREFSRGGDSGRWGQDRDRAPRDRDFGFGGSRGAPSERSFGDRPSERSFGDRPTERSFGGRGGEEEGGGGWNTVPARGGEDGGRWGKSSGGAGRSNFGGDRDRDRRSGGEEGGWRKR